MNPITRFSRSLIAAACVLGALAPGLAHARGLGVEVWTDRGDDTVYEPGDVMTLKARTSDDAYLLVYEIDSEGNVRLLYPSRRGVGLVEGKHTIRVPEENSRYELAVGQKTGQGFMVAIASRTPFRELPWFLRPYDPQAEDLGYEREDRDEEGFDEDGRVVGDPYVAMERIRRQVLGRGTDEDDFASSYTSYYVGHEVRYPRYICNDCHRPGQWRWWNDYDPYYTNCSVFDFRVNWAWGWGRPMWTSYLPYYYYVVRVDCPPNYRTWYNDRTRWSSWDGWNRWNQLWGGNLRRFKPVAPPQGYQAPPKIRGTGDPNYVPPGYISSRVVKRGGGSVPMPIGRNRRDDGVDTRSPSTQWRTPKQSGKPAERPTREPARRPRDDDDRSQGRGVRERERPSPRYETPDHGRGKNPPPSQYDPPRKERRDDPPPQVNPPRKERRDDPPPQVDPPRRERRDDPPPRQDPPRKERRDDPPPRQERRDDPPPRQDPPPDRGKGDNGGGGNGHGNSGGKHKGGGGG